MAVLPGGASTSHPPEAGRGRPSSSQLSSLWLHRVGCGGYEDVPERGLLWWSPLQPPGDSLACMEEEELGDHGHWSWGPYSSFREARGGAPFPDPTRHL